MLSVMKTFLTFTSFLPGTAEQAVDRFVRCRRNGLKGYLVPECLIACAQGLPPAALIKFEAWCINPKADLSSLDLVEQKEICEANNCIFESNARRVEAAIAVAEKEDARMSDEVPPLPAEYEPFFAMDDDEKEEPICEEKLPEISTLTLESPRGTPPPSDR